MMLPAAAVHALGMGEIEVHSALNEPLKAQIKLLSASAGELSALQVALASSEAFSRMGIERSSTLRELRFEVVRQGAGAPYISIVSDVPMREPFLDLILMANWSNGQLMREYTLLLDPPVFDEGEAVAPVMAAKTGSAAIDRGQKTVAVTAPPAAKPAPWVAPAGGYGPTSRTDTLWAVAREMRPNSSVTVPQMMIALLKENPEAFADGNVNSLKAGYILRSPSLDVINSISNAQAVAETNRHYQEWQAAAGKAPAVNRRQQLAAAPAASSTTATAQPTTMPAAPVPTAESGARLKLLSPAEARQQGGAGGSSSQGKGGSTTEQLAMALESAEASKQENAELKARLTDLERQLQAVQRLLTLKGDTLGALQAGVGQEPGVAVQQPGAAGPVAGEEVEQPSEIAGAVTSADKPVAETKPVPVSPAAQPEAVAEASLVEQIMADPVLLAASAGAPLLLLLVAALIRRRRQQAELQEVGAFAGAMAPMGEERMPKAVMAAGGAGIVAKPVADEEKFGETIEESSASNDFSAASGMGAIQTEESEIDPIAEADVYLAYRRYEQAEALLKEAIRNDGSRNELKLKLLEIYFTTKDKDAFEAQAEALYASLAGREDELWGQAVEMGREIAPEHPLFAEAGGVSPSSLGAVATGAMAAGLSAAAADEAFSFEEHPSNPDVADELSFDLSDEDLASSLNMPSLDEVDIAAAEALEELSAADEFSLEDDVAATDGLQNLDDDLAVIADGEEVELDSIEKVTANEELANDEFSLDDALIGGEAPADFGSGLDDLISGLDLGQMDHEQEGGAGDTVADTVKSGGESDAWTIAPAISSFQSRDVKGEMDDGYIPVTNVVKDAATPHNLDHLSLDGSDLDLGGEPESNIFEGSDDIVGTKLDLARAYIDMGDQSGARSILAEVVKEGDDNRRQEAEQLIRQIS